MWLQCYTSLQSPLWLNPMALAVLLTLDLSLVFAAFVHFLLETLFPSESIMSHYHKFSPTLWCFLLPFCGLSIHWLITIFLKNSCPRLLKHLTSAVLSNSKASSDHLYADCSQILSLRWTPWCFPLNIQLSTMPVYATAPKFLKWGCFRTNLTISSRCHTQ